MPPKWVIEPKNSNAVEGNSVKIDCAADGFPIVQITWKRLVKESNIKGVHQQYLLIRSGPKYQVFENGTLRIAKIDVLDLGEYLCQVLININLISTIFDKYYCIITGFQRNRSRFEYFNTLECSHSRTFQESHERS